MKYPLSDVWISDKEIAYVTDAITRGDVSGTGDYVSRFESLLVERLFRDHAIAVSSGTVALQIALKALRIQPGDEVIVPALTFAAPAAAAAFLGAVPVIVDVDPVTWTIDPQRVKEAVNRSTKAIIAVDLLGHPADFDAIHAVAPRIPLIEDASQAHGAKYRQIPCGGNGLISTIAFDADKSITCGEGGAVLTNDEALAARIRLLVNDGMSDQRPYWHTVMGTNARMSNLNAALGLAQVERWSELVKARIAVDKAYRKLIHVGKFRDRSKQAYPSCWLSCLTVADKDRMLESLRGSDFADARSIWTPLCDLPIYEARFECPIARDIAGHTIWLPTYGRMTENDVSAIAAVVNASVTEPIM